MPLLEMLPLTAGTTQWDVWGTVARISVTDPATLDDAAALVRTELDAVDAACSRFRSDSEIQYAARAGGRTVTISPLLADLVRTALDAARTTDGDVDPTLGNRLAELGYDRDFAAINATAVNETAVNETAAERGENCGADPFGYDSALGYDDNIADKRGGHLTVHTAPDWRDIRLDGNRLTVPADVQLDLGATAKARAADLCAALVSARCRTGVLVGLGGDIATAGPAPTISAPHHEAPPNRPPHDGWRILVRDGLDEPADTVTIPAGAALATSSTISRSWQQGQRTLHHILDPATATPAPRVWRTVSVAAYTCVQANTLSTAAIVRGHRAISWLRHLHAPARLIAADKTVTTVGAWR